jgi:heme/copper-type cytochrome/quinol oxidase subunit 3
MSTAAVPRTIPLPLETERGTYGVWLTVLTEAFLFIGLFASYYTLGRYQDRWKVEQLPSLGTAFEMLGVLVLSGIFMFLGELQVKKRNYGTARIALVLTMLCGMGYLVLQSFSFVNLWSHLTPTKDAYGSLYYTINIVHSAHLIVGLLILLYVLVLPRYAPTTKSPHRPLHVAAIYWYFVIAIWFATVGVLYVGPHT